MGVFFSQGVQSHLVKYVFDNAANLTYERLSREIDNMVGQDRSWTNFVMAMNVGKRVCLETSKACSAVTSYFQRYVSHSYSQAMQQAGGVVSLNFSLCSTSCSLSVLFYKYKVLTRYSC